MHTIEIRCVSYVRDLFGEKMFMFSFEETLDVYGLFKKLDEKFDSSKTLLDEFGAFKKEFRVLLRGRDVRLMDEKALLVNDGDIVLIMPILAGG